VIPELLISQQQQNQMSQLQKLYGTYKGDIIMLNIQVQLQFPSKQLSDWAGSLE